MAAGARRESGRDRALCGSSAGKDDACTRGMQDRRPAMDAKQPGGTGDVPCGTSSRPSGWI